MALPIYDSQVANAAKKARHKAKTAANLKLNWTRKRAIHAKCSECSCGQRAEANNCVINDCPLWPFRMRSTMDVQEVKQWEGRYLATKDARDFLGKNNEENDCGDDNTMENSK